VVHHITIHMLPIQLCVVELLKAQIKSFYTVYYTT
jgi:hypothetical protein